MLASRHQMGVPIFLLVKARKKCPRAAPFGAAIRLLGHATALQGWVYRSARCRPLCLERPSTGSGSSAQLSLAKPLAQLAWAAPCAAEPQAEPRPACSHTPAIAQVCPTRHRAQSSTWILPLPYFPTLLFLLQRYSINHH